jgi:hypothetical protein
MQPRMSPAELALFEAFVRHSDKYLEFGSGGSTVLASTHVTSWIVSVDSSEAWLTKVSETCAGNPTRPELHHVDIGETGDWGYPKDVQKKDSWPLYHSSIWDSPKSAEADLYLVDGRFRVACFAQVALHCASHAIIGVHDFASRKQYHPIRELAREIATVEDLSFFQTRPGTRDEATRVRDRFCCVPA